MGRKVDLSSQRYGSHLADGHALTPSTGPTGAPDFKVAPRLEGDRGLQLINRAVPSITARMRLAFDPLIGMFAYPR